MHFRRSRPVPAAAVVALTIAVGCAAAVSAPAVEVRVHSKVEAVAHMTGPASIELAPGESREVTIKVAANFPWRLSFGSANPTITSDLFELSGRAGGFEKAGNTIKVFFRCDPAAAGPQSGEIEYTIERL
ncbi:MAG TPA: hypothetical protein VMM36_18270 [Opitutaceae bacterium]|nr:hypothetical protein [Opitutaceae bacterium]